MVALRQTAGSCHAWTAPRLQELAALVQPCVRPVCAVNMTTGHNAPRGSVPCQTPAFDRNGAAVALVPDTAIDRMRSQDEVAKLIGWLGSTKSSHTQKGKTVKMARRDTDLALRQFLLAASFSCSIARRTGRSKPASPASRCAIIASRIRGSQNLRRCSAVFFTTASSPSLRKNFPIWFAM